MATQDHCPNFYGDTNTGNQHSNIDLNQNYRHECKDSFRSKSVTADSKKITNYDFDNSRTRKDLNSWNKSNKSLSSHFLNFGCGIPEEKAEVKKEGKDSNVNSSTLSLHIASYEATNDPLNDKNECLKEKSEKSAFYKTCTNAKQFLAGSPSLNQNIYEFPRQQENENFSTPDIAQFIASQKLLNPNTMHQNILADNAPAMVNGYQSMIMNSDFLSRPSFGKVHLANVSETENGVQYVVDPKQEYDVYITSDDKFVKLQRVPDGENLLLSLADYRVVPLKSKMILFFVTNVFEYRKEKAFGMSLGINFLTDEEAKQFCKSIQMAITLNNKAPTTKSVTNSESDFNSRTEENSATQYFQFYSWLSQQQNMMQDFVRTSTYQKAMHMNPSDFRDKIVLDVGAGSGVLSFFAVQAGAKKVYAVEASQMAAHCAELVRTNNLSDRITVIPGKIEEVQLPEKVDVIISEPMGYMLVNERMLESYMYGRKFLKPGGRMFPTTGDLYFALFNDDALFMEHNQKYSFWTSTNFLGIDLSALKGAAYQEIFKQPIVDTWHPSTLISDFGQWIINFEKDAIEKLHVIEVEYELTAKRTAFCHGVATWFDVSFLGTDHQTYLSTSPNAPLTHWYQVRCPIMNPVLVRVNDKVRIQMKMVANERQSYDITMTISVNGHSQTAEYDLKNPSFRYSGAAVAPAAGLSNESATQQLANTVYSVDQDGNAISYPQDQNYVYVDGTEQQYQQQDYSQVNGFINPNATLNALLSNQTSPLNICPLPPQQQQQTPAQPSLSTSPFKNGV